MPNADWYPTALAALIPWHANFAAQATATGTTHGLSAGQVTQIGVDSAVVEEVVNYLAAVSAFSQAFTEFKDIMLRGPLNTPMPTPPAPPPMLSFEGGQLPAIEARTRQYAAIIKADPDYTQAFGED